MAKRGTEVTTVLLSGDWHLSANPRDSYRKDFIRQEIPKVIKQHEITDLIVLGDLTEDKDSHSSHLVNGLVEAVVTISALVESITFIKGNHDYLNDPDLPFFRFLQYLPKVSWINQPAVSNIGLGGSVLFLPHTRNYKKDWADFNLRSYEFIFTHMTFAGAQGENGQELPGGVPVDIFGPKDKKRPIVYSGDVHVPQQVGPVTYVGAPYTIDFGDKFKPQMLIVTDDGQEMVIPSKGPQKRLVTVMDVADLPKERVNEGDILKVRVGITADEHAKWGQIQETVRAWGQKKGCVVFIVEPVVLSADKKSSAKRLLRARKEDGALVKEYAQQRGRGDAIVRTGLKLLDET